MTELMSQMIWCARTCYTYVQFLKRGKFLTNKLIKQDYQQFWLKSSFRKFYDPYNKLVSKYNRLLVRMLADVFFILIVRPLLFTEKLTDFPADPIRQRAHNPTSNLCRGSCLLCSCFALILYFRLLILDTVYYHHMSVVGKIMYKKDFFFTGYSHV